MKRILNILRLFYFEKYQKMCSALRVKDEHNFEEILFQILKFHTDVNEYIR